MRSAGQRARARPPLPEAADPGRRARAVLPAHRRLPPGPSRGAYTRFVFPTVNPLRVVGLCGRAGRYSAAQNGGSRPGQWTRTWSTTCRAPRWARRAPPPPGAVPSPPAGCASTPRAGTSSTRSVSLRSNRIRFTCSGEGSVYYMTEFNSSITKGLYSHLDRAAQFCASTGGAGRGPRRHSAPPHAAVCTMRLECSRPPSHKRVAISIQAPGTRPGYLQAHRT